MKTYQDLQKIADRDDLKIDFVYTAINAHKTSDIYKLASTAEEYMKRRNTTIVRYRKLLYKLTGQAVEDDISPNYKLASNFLKLFVTQQNQYLLGNGVNWNEEGTADKLGTKKYPFDKQLKRIGRNALVAGVAYGFWNYDHIDVFDAMEFVPFQDEETGAIRAGIRFWQLSSGKPLRATLYEEDGYTEYIWRDGKGEVLKPKATYVQLKVSTPADGTQIIDGYNYATFPIVPLYANDERVAMFEGMRQEIDCYDLVKSGYANTVDDASIIYWVLNNAGGMDDVDLAKFLDRVRKNHAFTVEDGVSAEPHILDVPHEGRDQLLEKLRSDMYEFAMALDTKNISDGAITATQIQAAYEPLNEKTDDYEYQLDEFIYGILELAGIEDAPTYSRSVIVNKQEEIQNVIDASVHLSEEYTVEKLLTILGDIDKLKDVLKEIDAQEINQVRAVEEDQEDIE